MSKTGISISLLPQSVVNVQKALKKFDQDVQKRISMVIAEAGIKIQTAAKKKSPVDFGFLRGSIYLDIKNKVSINKSGIRPGGKTLITTPSPESSKDGLNAIIGSSLNYAMTQEHKHRFLNSAYSDIAPKIQPAIERQINEAISKAF